MIMICCEHHARPNGCNKGRTCPVRATRNAGVCTAEPPARKRNTEEIDLAGFVALCIAAYLVICVLLGMLWATHGDAIESILMALLANVS